MVTAEHLQSDIGAAACEIAGPVAAPAIVFVHGSVVTRKMWLPQIRELSDAFRVIAPDLPGHGARAHVPFSFTGAADEVAAVIARETQGAAVVVGLSLGGYVAMELASRHPERVRGLVLAGCSVNFKGGLAWYLRIVGTLMQWGWLKQRPDRLAQKTRRLFPPALADIAEQQFAAGLYPKPLGPAFSAMGRKDFVAMLSPYPGPVLVLNGERDTRMCRGAAEFVAAAKHASARVIEGAGHASSLEQPAAFNHCVRNFAASVCGGEH